MLRWLVFAAALLVAAVGRGIPKRRKPKKQLDREAEFNQAFTGIRQAIRQCSPMDIWLYEEGVTAMYHTYADLSDAIRNPRIEELREEIYRRRVIATCELNN